MFGYVVANKEALEPDALQRYQSCYCGLCRTLGKRFGQTGRMTLTYDMTFLILLLASLYEPDNVNGSERCLVHPTKQHQYWYNQFTAYAADMNIVLAYHKLLDDWQDEKNILSYAAAKMLKKRYERLKIKYPRQCDTIIRSLNELRILERKENYDLDTAANCFGSLMSELFVFQEDNWAPTLRRMAAALGRFIYTMDAYEDIKDDIQKQRYNPLRTMYEEDYFEERCKDILTLFISECAMEFEKLPIIQDNEILINILYSGVWTKYIHIQKEKNGSERN
ncbi:MAG: DUF5685 family protein [Clostridia bacterium]|jgi:hypothetical protein